MKLVDIAKLLTTWGALLALVLMLLDFFTIYQSNQITSPPINPLILLILRVVVSVILFQRGFSKQIRYTVLLSVLVMLAGLFIGYLGGLLVFIGGLLIFLDIQFS